MNALSAVYRLAKPFLIEFWTFILIRNVLVAARRVKCQFLHSRVPMKSLTKLSQPASFL